MKFHSSNIFNNTKDPRLFPSLRGTDGEAFLQTYFTNIPIKSATTKLLHFSRNEQMYNSFEVWAIETRFKHNLVFIRVIVYSGLSLSMVSIFFSFKCLSCMRNFLMLSYKHTKPLGSLLLLSLQTVLLVFDKTIPKGTSKLTNMSLFKYWCVNKLRYALLSSCLRRVILRTDQDNLFPKLNPLKQTRLTCFQSFTHSSRPG